jgi:hypothetical protein
MRYIINWFERPQGSPTEYENAQKRILEVFGQWKVIRVEEAVKGELEVIAWRDGLKGK